MGKRSRRKYTKFVSLTDDNVSDFDSKSTKDKVCWSCNVQNKNVNCFHLNNSISKHVSDIQENAYRDYNNTYHVDVNANITGSYKGNRQARWKQKRNSFSDYRRRGKAFYPNRAEKFYPDNRTVSQQCSIDRNIRKRNDVYFHWNDLSNSVNVFQGSDYDDSIESISHTSSDSDYLDASGFGDWVYVPNYPLSFPTVQCCESRNSNQESPVEQNDVHLPSLLGLSFNITYVRRVDVPLEIIHNRLEQPNTLVRQVGNRAEVSLKNVLSDDDEICPTCRHCRRSITVDLTDIDVEFSVLLEGDSDLLHFEECNGNDISYNVWQHLPFVPNKHYLTDYLWLKNLSNEYLECQDELPYIEQSLECYQNNQLQPLPRQWVQLSTPNDSHPVGLFTVMCYNVLCDKYATRAQYGYCPSWALNWDYRKKGILEEIRRGGADILALQEIETEQYNTFFLPELKELGYDSVFSPRSRARTMHESERKHVDGCAIFFRRTKFSLVHEHLIEFNQMAMSSAEGSHEMLNRVMTKDNIGFAALLEAKDAFWVHGLPPEGSHRQQQLLVTTCHIHWDPAFCDVKLVQSIMLMHELKNIVNEAQLTLRPGASGSNDCNGIPLVLCGDFNSLPDSGVVQYLSTGRMEANHREFIDIGYNDCLQKMSTSDGKDSYTHNFRLQQAYTADTLKCTNFTHDFKGIIDYVFFSRDWIRTLGVLAMTETSWFDQHHIVGCPHPSVPSDHLPLLVELELDPLSSPFTSSSSSSSSSRNLYQHPNHR